MDKTQVITGILLVLSFIWKAVMDLSGKDWFKKPFWNKTQSWQNKYSFPLEKGYNHWYYLGLIKPIYKEKFPFSTTILVVFTDGWHLAQFFFLNCLFIALAVNMPYPVLDFILIRIIYSITFNAIYK